MEVRLKMEIGAADGYAKGLMLLSAAKRILAVAKKLDDEDAATLRKVSDDMTQRGLGLVVKGARELEAALKARPARTDEASPAPEA